MQIADAITLSQKRLALIIGLAAMVSAAILATWMTHKALPPRHWTPDAASLAKLPARPEDIEAHGQAATSVLAPDAARQTNASVPFATGPLDLARPFVFRGSNDDRAQAVRCLSTAVLYEAGDDTGGEEAVAQVILNRVRHAAFPGTVCGVVYQGANRSTGCQFTFACDGSLRRTMPDAAWGRARAVAELALDGRVDERVGLATHYHTNWVYPYWSPTLRKLAQVGTHLFFGWPGGWGGPLAFGRVYRGSEPAVTQSMPVTGPEPAIVEDPNAPQLEDSAVPGLGGFQQQPAKLLGSVGHVPLYGNKLKLARADGRAFGLLTTSETTAAKLINAALALCAKPGACEVQAWSNEDDIPGGYPIPAGTLNTMVFDYRRDDGSGGGTTRFDCSRFPNRNTKLCLPSREAGL